MTLSHLIPIRGFSTQSLPPVNAELGSLNMFDYYYDGYYYHYSYHNSHHQYHIHDNKVLASHFDSCVKQDVEKTGKINLTICFILCFCL